MITCEMTMSDDGKNNVDGYAHYWQCGRKAKWVIMKRPGPGSIPVCGMHAVAERKICVKLKLPLPEPLI